MIAAKLWLLKMRLITFYKISNILYGTKLTEDVNVWNKRSKCKLNLESRMLKLDKFLHEDELAKYSCDQK